MNSKEQIKIIISVFEIFKTSNPNQDLQDLIKELNNAIYETKN